MDNQTADPITEKVTVEFKCGPCLAENHKAGEDVLGGCPCAVNNHKGFPN